MVFRSVYFWLRLSVTVSLSGLIFLYGKTATINPVTSLKSALCACVYTCNTLFIVKDLKT